MRRFVNVVIFVLLAFGSSFAQPVNKPHEPVTDSLEEVVITATRKYTVLLSLPYSVSSVNRKQSDDYQYRTTPETLAGVTGVFIQKTNHGGGSPFIRGLTGNQTLLLLDGVRFNNATFRYGPNQYLNTIDAYTVKNIEVVRGSGSVQYGSDALGGVVQVFTKDPAFYDTKTWHGAATVKAATHHMEYTGRGELSYGSKKLAFIAGFTRRNFGDLVGGDTTGKQHPSGYNEVAFDVKLKWKPTINSVVTASHQFVKQNDVPVYHRVQLEDYKYSLFAPQQRQMSYARLEVHGNHRIIEKITATASLQNSFENRSYQKNGSAFSYNEKDKIKTFGLAVDVHSWITKSWTANSGIEYYHDKVNSSKQRTEPATDKRVMQRGLYPDNATIGNFSAYTLHHFAFNKFRIEAGLRYNHFVIKIPDTVTTSFKLGDIVVKPSSMVGNMALLYHIAHKHVAYASFSTGYRAPNIDDMGTLGLVDFRYELPAYDLKPEKTYNTEIGYRFAGRRTAASIAFYYMHLSDLITRVQVTGEQVGGYNVYTKENNQQSFIKGIEASFDIRITKSFDIKAGASYAYGQNLSVKEPLRRIPPFNSRLITTWRKNRLQASIEQVFAAKQNRLARGDRDDNRIPAGGTPAWYVSNIYSGYSFSHFAIRLGFLNLFNEDYRTHGSGINGQGRSASLSLHINL
ncbi:MAG: TonB-dependent receptor [Bacteroidota bacterium]